MNTKTRNLALYGLHIEDRDGKDITADVMDFVSFVTPVRPPSAVLAEPRAPEQWRDGVARWLGRFAA